MAKAYERHIPYIWIRTDRLLAKFFTTNFNDSIIITIEKCYKTRKINHNTIEDNKMTGEKRQMK